MGKRNLLVFFWAVHMLFCTEAFSQEWTLLGPSQKPVINDSTDRALAQACGIGRVGALRFVGKQRQQKAIICTPYDGIRISNGRFTAWKRPLQEGLPATGIADVIAIDAKGKKLFAVTGDADCGLDPNGPAMNSESCQSRGVFQSDDGGSTWSGPIGHWHMFNGEVDTMFWNYPSLKVSRKIVMDPCKKSRMFMIVFTCDPVTRRFSSMVYRTSNKGADWYPVLIVRDEELKDVEVLPGKGSVILVSGKTVYRSVDHGQHWESLQQLGLPPVSDVNRCEMAFCKSDSREIFVMALNAKSKMNELYVFSVKENAFRKVCSGSISPEWRTALAVDSKNPALIYFTAGNKVNRFERKGSAWHTLATGVGPHDDVHDLIADLYHSGVLYASTDGGLYRTIDSGKTWCDLSSGLNVAECWGVDVFCDTSTHEMKVLAGLQDCGTVLLSKSIYSDSSGWKIVRGGDGMQPAIGSEDGRFMYATDGNNNLNHYSNDGGQHWKMTGTVRGEVAEYVRPFVRDPLTAHRLYTGYSDVYRSDDDGSHWIPLHVKDSGGKGQVAAIAVAPGNNDILYAGYAQPCWSDSTSGKLFRTVDGGAHWQDISSGLRGVAWTSITSIAVDPLNPFSVMVGFRGGWTVKVMYGYVLQDSTVKWMDYSAGLPIDADVNGLAFYSSADKVKCYAATHRGVFVQDDAGNGWRDFNGNMPRVLTLGLDIDQASGIMVAGTHGAGVWMTHLR